MKKIFVLVALLLLLTSCGKMTPQEIQDGKKYCESIGELFVANDGSYDGYFCSSNYETTDYKIRKCIQMYVDAIDEKYNNPDTVSNLREDNYSQVVKTCNETFGEKSLSGSVKK